MYSSTDVCRMANVTKKTLRHYDRLQLLSPSRIDDNGYWYYDEDDVSTLQLIKNLQTIGFSLREIKLNLKTDCRMLRDSIPQKLRYIDEQIIQLQLAKNLLKRIRKLEGVDPVEAISIGLEEEHMAWYRKNLPAREYQLVESMMSLPGSMEDHNRIVSLLASTKPFVKDEKRDALLGVIEKIKAIFLSYGLNARTAVFLLESFIRSNLDGPLSQRILTIQEAVYILNHLDMERD